MAQGDLPLAAGGDGALVIGHGAGAVRVHLADFQRRVAAVLDHKGMAQLPVFEDFPEVEVVFGHHHLGLRRRRLAGPKDVHGQPHHTQKNHPAD